MLIVSFALWFQQLLRSTELSSSCFAINVNSVHSVHLSRGDQHITTQVPNAIKIIDIILYNTMKVICIFLSCPSMEFSCHVGKIPSCSIFLVFHKFTFAKMCERMMVIVYNFFLTEVSFQHNFAFSPEWSVFMIYSLASHLKKT